MPVQRDPEKIEVKYLHEFTGWPDAHILEIGCGDGRLTWRYAASAGRVVAADPAAERLATALDDCPPALRPNLTFAQARAEALPFPRETYDLAILAWSL